MEEPMEIIIQASKAAKGFKIATTISASIPLFYSFRLSSMSRHTLAETTSLDFSFLINFALILIKKAIWIFPY